MIPQIPDHFRTCIFIVIFAGPRAPRLSEAPRGERRRHSDERSRGLSHHSTGIDADGLDFRVRNGTGYFPIAMAVHNFLSNVN